MDIWQFIISCHNYKECHNAYYRTPGISPLYDPASYDPFSWYLFTYLLAKIFIIESFNYSWRCLKPGLIGRELFVGRDHWLLAV